MFFMGGLFPVERESAVGVVTPESDPARVELFIGRGIVRPLRGRVAFARITLGWHPRLFMLDASSVSGARSSRRFNERMFVTVALVLDAAKVQGVERAESHAPSAPEAATGAPGDGGGEGFAHNLNLFLNLNLLFRRIPHHHRAR